MSVQDKEFIQKLYGSTLGDIDRRNRYFELIEFDYTGTTPALTLKATKNIAVIWDKDAGEASHFYLPADSSRCTFTATHTFTESKKHRIIVAEILDQGVARPSESTALTAFDLTTGAGADNFDIKLLNKALGYIRIMGGGDFISQDFNFTGYNNLKELYLVEILDSKVTLKNCDSLEVFATSRFVHKPNHVSGPQLTTVVGGSTDNVYGEIEGPVADWPEVGIIAQWPNCAEWNYSLSDLNSSGLTIENCSSLREISLEHTRLKNIDFNDFPNLEYVYLSSTQDYLVGGGSGDNKDGEYLATAFSTLWNRGDLSTGLIVLRGVTKATNIYPRGYVKVGINRDELDEINHQIGTKNWTVVWDSGIEVWFTAVPWPGNEE